MTIAHSAHNGDSAARFREVFGLLAGCALDNYAERRKYVEAHTEQLVAITASDRVRQAGHELFMTTMAFYGMRCELGEHGPIPESVVAALAELVKACRCKDVDCWAILIKATGHIALSQAASDPGVLRALDRARAARQSVL